MKRAGLRTILFALAHVLRTCARVYADFRPHMRQRDIVAQIRLSTFSDLARGDLLLTGTPAGCALRIPPAPVRKELTKRSARAWRGG